MGRLVGIDLGTTNSVVAAMDGPRPRILENKEGKRQTRSIVGLRTRRGREGADGELLVGDPAFDSWGFAPTDTIVSIKRLLGRGFADPEVQKVKNWAQYKVVEPADGTKDSVRVIMGGREYSPIEISAMILRKLKEDAEFRLSEEVTHAVVTVPAYFSQIQKDATRKAGIAAGLNVIKILDEPTAAAIAYGMDSGAGSEATTLLVYDLGGGTFDIAVLMMAGGTFAPLNLEGDMWLGGDNFDLVLVEHAVQALKGDYPDLDPTANARFIVELTKAAQKTKEALSAARSADLIVASMLPDGEGNLIDVDMEVTREDYERMISPLIERTSSLVEQSLRNANVTPDQVDHVLMAGNSTMIPLVQQTMEQVFGADKVLRRIHPKECVAMGAAIVAAVIGPRTVCLSCEHVNEDGAETCAKCGESLAFEPIGLPPEEGSAAPAFTINALVGIAPFSYGIESAGGVLTVFVRKGDPCPTQKPQMHVFSTRVPNARMIYIPIYGGDNLESAAANERQGDAFAILPPGLPANTPVRVKLWLDGDGVFKLSAHLENGEDLQPWIVEKGEAQERAIEELEQAERELGQKAQSAAPDEVAAVEKSREKVFRHMQAGEFDKALAEVRRGKNLADKIGQVDEGEALREKAKHLINFTVFITQQYGWTFEETRRDALNDLADKTKSALGEGDLAILEARVAKLDAETDELPDVLKAILGLRGVIMERVHPSDPSGAARLERKLAEAEQALKSRSASGVDALNSLTMDVVEAMENIPEFSNGTPCSQGHMGPAGERRCPVCNEDKWMLA